MSRGDRDREAGKAKPRTELALWSLTFSGALGLLAVMLKVKHEIGGPVLAAVGAVVATLVYGVVRLTRR